MAEQGTAVLVRGGRLPAGPFRLGGGAALAAEAEPLFASIGRDAPGLAVSAAEWQLLRVAGADPAASPWDLCHALLAEGFGFAGAPAVEFAEPDLAQSWRFGADPALAMRAAAVCPDKGAPQNPRYPRGTQSGAFPDWYQDEDHAQFRLIPSIFDPSAAPRVRIAHLDTGYDPAHESRPAFVSREHQRSFVAGDDPTSAADTTSGLLTQLGHGAGTIGILAGPAIGAAPFAEVIPLRVADRVVLFRTSAIARALDHVHALSGTEASFVHAVTISMGGIASQAWAEAVNALYERGVFIAAAAGNNFGGLPTRHIVFPARFRRVTAACGTMADHSPYADLGLARMAGNYGPPAKMATTIAACTPNLPWPRHGCARVIDGDGGGTSAATPQVAAAAALWIQHHHAAWRTYPERWMRVEAVRKALFATAAPGDRDRLGHGRLRAADALRQAPAAADALRREPPDEASFPVLRVLTGLGLNAEPTPRERMLELEALQLSQSAAIEALLPEGPEVAPGSAAGRRRLTEALADHPRASAALRAALGAAAGRGVRVGALPAAAEGEAVAAARLAHATAPPLPEPSCRHLRVFALDPSLAARLETLGLNETTLEIPWERVEPGPVGASLEVVDIDPASGAAYAPVDLDDPALIAAHGLAPSEADPRFHQQMVYAVAMRTIGAFERALGRPVLWAPHVDRDAGGRLREHFVARLRIYPHALRAANAYYSPERKALLFGYFRARAGAGAEHVPDGIVFTCLSHDVIAHETAHALLDGVHRRFREPTNPDVLAFHEAFADIVALFQHFGIAAALEAEIARTRGDLGRENLLGALARQFGRAVGGHGALRDFIGETIERDGETVWVPRPPRPTDYAASRQPHARGAVLVAAVFDAFRQIYHRRAEVLVRLASGGSGVLPEGALPEVLVRALAEEAAKAARHVLGMCIRALDYCPPVDITFGEYLRALVTADRDMAPADPLGYRTALVSAFRARGIQPEGVGLVAAESLLWEPPELQPTSLAGTLRALARAAGPGTDRRRLWERSRRQARLLKRWLDAPDRLRDEERALFGLRREPGPLAVAGRAGRLQPIEVHAVRHALRVGPDGETRRDLVVEATQSWVPDDAPQLRLRGGCTLLIDTGTAELRYCIRKTVAHPRRTAEQIAFAAEAAAHAAEDPYGLDRPGREPFAVLHAHGPGE
jgi:subtilisin family serine protease